MCPCGTSPPSCGGPRRAERTPSPGSRASHCQPGGRPQGVPRARAVVLPPLPPHCRHHHHPSRRKPSTINAASSTPPGMAMLWVHAHAWRRSPWAGAHCGGRRERAGFLASRVRRRGRSEGPKWASNPPGSAGEAPAALASLGPSGPGEEGQPGALSSSCPLVPSGAGGGAPPPISISSPLPKCLSQVFSPSLIRATFRSFIPLCHGLTRPAPLPSPASACSGVRLGREAKNNP